MRKNFLMILFLVVIVYSFGMIQITNTMPVQVQSNFVMESVPIDFKFDNTYSNSVLNDDTLIVPNVSEILDPITDFVPSMTNEFTPRIIGEYYLSVYLDNLTVWDDKDGIGLGAGEIYFDYYTGSYGARYDNTGSYYSMNDGEMLIFNYLVFEGWVNETDIFIQVSESDIDLDDDLGFVFISGVYDFNWSVIADTDTLDATIGISAYITGFRTMSIDAEDLAELYQPFLNLDVNDYGDAPTGTFYRVLEGFDSVIGQNTILLQYFYYWPYELDNFGSQLGHYYDFSPLYIYIEHIGASPYRLVFQSNNPGITALPARLAIYDDVFSTSQSWVGNYNITESLKPLLGETITLDFDTKPLTSEMYTTGYYGYNSTEFPYAVKPNIYITDSYHNLELNNLIIGETPVTTYPPLIYFDNAIIKFFYSLLDESFNSPLHDYSWNNYEVPENLSLTIDMLYDPYTYPYIVDNFEEVTHQNRFAREKDNSILNIDYAINTSLTVPTTLYMNYTDNMDPDSSQGISFKFDVDQENVLFTIDYEISIKTQLNLFFFEKDINLTFSGSNNINFNLDLLQSFMKKTGLNNAYSGSQLTSFITIDSVYINPTVLGTIFSATVSFSLMSMLESVIGGFNPLYGIIIGYLQDFIGDIELTISPEVEGLIYGWLTTNTTSAGTSDYGSFYYNQENEVFTGNVNAFPSTNGEVIEILIDYLQYGLNFTNSWDLNFLPGTLMQKFVNPFSVHLGVWPSLFWKGGIPNVNENGSINSDQGTYRSKGILIGTQPSSTLSSTFSSTSQTTSPSTITPTEPVSLTDSTSSTTSLTTANAEYLLGLLSIGLLLYKRKRRRK